jgi:hypothetical protein
MPKKSNNPNKDNLAKLEKQEIQDKSQEVTAEELDLLTDDESVNDVAVEEVKVKTPLQKPKKNVNPKSIEAGKNNLIAFRERKKKEIEERNILLQQKQDEAQKSLEEKIIKKAIAIKKRQIKQQEILNSIPQDDTPIEEIKEIVKKNVKQNIINNPIVERKPSRSVSDTEKEVKETQSKPKINWI